MSDTQPRQRVRQPLTEASVLSVPDAVRELRGRKANTKKWLEDNGLVQDVPGLGKRVSWREVLELVEAGGQPKEAKPRAVPRKLPRCPL